MISESSENLEIVRKIDEESAEFVMNCINDINKKLRHNRTYVNYNNYDERERYLTFRIPTGMGEIYFHFTLSTSMIDLHAFDILTKEKYIEILHIDLLQDIKLLIIKKLLEFKAPPRYGFVYNVENSPSQILNNIHTKEIILENHFLNFLLEISS